MNERSASSCGAKGQQRRAPGQNAINGEKKPSVTYNNMECSRNEHPARKSQQKAELENFLIGKNVSVCFIQETHLNVEKTFRI